MSQNFNWDEIKASLEKLVEIKKSDEDLSITLKVLDEGAKNNKLVGNFMKDEDEMKKNLNQFLGRTDPLECKIIMDEENREILITFSHQEDYSKVYELFHNMFFGDFFKEMIETMMGAFGSMFGKDD